MNRIKALVWLVGLMWGVCNHSQAEGASELLKPCTPGGYQLIILDPWVLGEREGASATLTATNSGEKRNIVVVTVAAASKSGEGWHLTLTQGGLKFTKGKSYKLTFSIKGENVDGLTVGLNQNHEPWGPIPGGDAQYVPVTSEWKEVSLNFTVGDNESNGSLAFLNFNKAGATFSLANMSMKDTSVAVNPADGDDLAVDLDRWHGANWFLKGSRENNAPEGKDALKITATETQYNFLTRSLVYPGEVAKVVFTGEALAQGVAKGADDYQAGRIGMVFLNGEGAPVGTAPAVASMLSGTSAWTPFRQELTAPAGVMALNLQATVFKTTGAYFVRQVYVKAYDKDGKLLRPAAQEGVKNDTSRWLPLKIGPEDTSRPVVLDYSSLRPAPAGKGGFVKAEKGGYTIGGKPIRFWGENLGWKIVDLDKPQMERFAEWISRVGYNMVRMPFLDNSWGNNIFDTAADNTLTVDPKKLDRIDYFVAECKKRGIYVYGDLMVYRKFKKGDGVRDWEKLPPGAPVAAQFNRRLIELQKGYAKALFDHVNPYTGLRWADDPVIAITVMINEGTTFWFDGYEGMPASYKEELDGLFTKWCTDNKVAKPAGAMRELMRKSDTTVFAFLKKVQDDYYKEMSDYLRKDLGAKCLLAGSNHWENHIGDIQSNAAYDYMDRHSYWDHPSTSPYNEMGNFENKSMLKNKKTNNLIAQNSRQRVLGMPYMVTEWNFCWPNEYCTEGALLMAANGLFQDWSGQIHFCSEETEWADKMTSCFNTRNKPQQVAPLAAAAFLWLRGDVSPGVLKAFEVDQTKLNDVMGVSVPIESGVTWRMGAYLGKKNVAESTPGVPFGQQINWTDDGVFTVDTPCTKAVLGFAGGREFKLNGATLKFEPAFGQVIATSLDNLPLESSKRILLCAISRAENTGQVFKDFKRGLLDGGQAPLLLEPFPFSVTLSRKAPRSTPKLRAVDWYGRRVPGDLPVSESGGTTVAVSVDGKSPYGWYELSFE